MHVSSENVIRFPVPVSPSAARVSPAATPLADVVAFAPGEEKPAFDESSQAHGQLFVAHRLVSRVADQLERTADL